MISRKGIFTRKQAPKKCNFWKWLDATYIERLIGLLKKTFAILQGDIPLRVVKSLKYEAENLGNGIVYQE